MHNFVSIFFLGLIYGATICSISCLPYLAPYLLSTGLGFTDGVKSSLLFLSGKLTCYMFIGGLSAYLGNVLMLDKSMSVKWIMGIAIIALGLSIPFVNKGGCCTKRQVVGKRVSLFVLGIATSLRPCPPLVAMFLLAAKNGSVLLGVSYGIIYGLGLILSPIIIAGGGIALISKAIKTESKAFVPYLQGISMVIIVVIGIKIIIF
ncbi:MAG: sulfite exporter TauE/SafE family protein [Nitrospinae bacterium]|nr:sulfite exporter TauE/SafE family protein [Nitrospinota bacterium]